MGQMETTQNCFTSFMSKDHRVAFIEWPEGGGLSCSLTRSAVLEALDKTPFLIKHCANQPFDTPQQSDVRKIF